MTVKSASTALLPLVLLASCTRWQHVPTVAKSGPFPTLPAVLQSMTHPEWARDNRSFPSYAGDLKPSIDSQSEDAAFEIVTYNFDHVWAGQGYGTRLRPKCANGNYRAKLTVKGEGGRLIAEVFFIDEDVFKPEPGGIHCNPWSAKPDARGYFFLYFPAGALAGVQQTLAQPGTRKLLAYYNREWSIQSVGDVSALH